MASGNTFFRARRLYKRFNNGRTETAEHTDLADRTPLAELAAEPQGPPGPPSIDRSGSAVM